MDLKTKRVRVAGRIRPCFTLLAMACVAAGAQAGRSYPLPQPFHEAGPSAESPIERALCSFYPVGWSRDGKFAFIEELKVESGDGMVSCWVFTVQNLSNDQVLWTWRSSALPNWQTLSLRDLWEGGAVDLQRVLAGQGIQPMDAAEGIVGAAGSRLSAQGREYLFSTRSETAATRIASPGGEGSVAREVIVKTEVCVEASDLGSKCIYRATLAAKERVVGVEVIGAMESPFEARAAVLVATVSLDAELGEVLSWRVVGAHLTRGFS